MNTTKSLSVTGMTCGNCVRHVTQALEALPGVKSVAVDLATGNAHVEAGREIPREEFAGALDEAGYSLA
jgi:copper chaperone CopZ